MAIEEGKAAPAFPLPDQNGDKVALSQFRGKSSVLVYFYPKDDTPGCTDGGSHRGRASSPL